MEVFQYSEKFYTRENIKQLSLQQISRSHIKKKCLTIRGILIKGYLYKSGYPLLDSFKCISEKGLGTMGSCDHHYSKHKNHIWLKADKRCNHNATLMPVVLCQINQSQQKLQYGKTLKLLFTAINQNR